MNASQGKINSLLLIGPTGTGKTPLGGCFEEHGIQGQVCFHFDFGNELRTIAGLEHPPEGFSREEHAFIKDVLYRGLLLENKHFHIAEKIIYAFTERHKLKENDIMVLNGLPRHIDQAKDMAGIVIVGAVIVLECTADKILKRIEGNTGGDRSGRTDDSPEMVNKKLKIFHERTAPLIDYYSNAGSKIIWSKVTAFSAVEKLYGDLLPDLPFTK